MTAGRNSISKNKTWNTPPKFVELINKMLGEVVLDPCSNETSMIDAKIKYILPTDGLKESWNYKTLFVNPPYGSDVENKTRIYDWIKKGVDANENYKSEILYLIPVATNTKHFKDLIFKKAKGLCFLKDTRLKFWSEGVEDKKGAPMACCFIYFGNNYEKFDLLFSDFGQCFEIKS